MHLHPIHIIIPIMEKAFRNDMQSQTTIVSQQQQKVFFSTVSWNCKLQTADFSFHAQNLKLS
jgi:hypothetical protein